MQRYKESPPDHNSGEIATQDTTLPALKPAHTKDTCKSFNFLFDQCNDAIISEKSMAVVNDYLLELHMFCTSNFCCKYTIIKFEPLCTMLNQFLDFPYIRTAITTLEIICQFIQYYPDECITIFSKHPLEVIFGLLENPDITFEEACDVLSTLKIICKCGDSDDILDLNVFQYPLSESPSYAYLCITVIGSLLEANWGFEQNPSEVLKFISKCFTYGRYCDNFEISDICIVFRNFISKCQTILPDIWQTGIPDTLVNMAVSSTSIFDKSSAMVMVVQSCQKLQPDAPEEIKEDILNAFSINELFDYVVEDGFLMSFAFKLLSELLRLDSSLYEEIAPRASIYAVAMLTDSDMVIKRLSVGFLAVLANAAPVDELPNIAESCIDNILDLAYIDSAKNFISACTRSPEAKEIITEKVEERLDDGTAGIEEIAQLIDIDI